MKLMKMTRQFAVVLAASSVVAGLSGCGPANEFVEPPPAQVTVQPAEVRDVTTFIEFPGRTEAFEEVEIRARVQGFLKERRFKAGEFVKEGDPLFLIEPDPFEAALASAEAELASAQASLEIAKTELKRKEQAAKTNAIAAVEVERAVADRDAALAGVKGAEAAVNNAKIDLSYTEVNSPINGRVSRDLVDLGNLVGGPDATLLTTVVKDNPVFAYFEANERQILPYLDTRPTAERDQLELKSGGKSVRLSLSDNSIYEKEGKLDFIDNRVDPTTGTIRLRAVFPNDGQKLAAGLFARVMIPEEVKGAILVPRHVVQRDLAGDFLLIVDDENKVQRRKVTPGNNVDDLAIIKEGLEGGERVIVEGLQRAREGIVVDPLTAGDEPKAETPASAPAAKGEAKSGAAEKAAGPEGKAAPGPEKKKAEGAAAEEAQQQ